MASKSTAKRSIPAADRRTLTSSVKDRPPPSTGKKTPAGRSRSVSAVPRTAPQEFNNKRDNPLFGCTSSSSPDSESAIHALKSGGDARRGRLPSRALASGARSESGASGGRRLRSVSRDHYGNSESEIDNGYTSASSLKSEVVAGLTADNQKVDEMGGIKLDDLDETRSMRKWSEQHPVSEAWDASSAQHWEDRVSTSSFSEMEDAITRMSDHASSDGAAGGIYETVRMEVQRAVSEIRHDLELAIRTKNSTVIPTENIVDISPELNADADIKREYEQSQERVRKLRADLAVEEQRGQELSNILKDMTIDPNSSGTSKPRPRRKASIERLKMSKRLAEEAMNYFDECVSISTFDSSDFSSAEEPQSTSTASNPAIISSRFFPSVASASRPASFHHNQQVVLDDQTQCSVSIVGSGLAVNSSCSGSKAATLMHTSSSSEDPASSGTSQNGSPQFSFAQESRETVGVKNIIHYVKSFKKVPREKSLERETVGSNYSSEDYYLNITVTAESLLYDKLIYRDRIESGSMLICDIRIF